MTAVMTSPSPAVPAGWPGRTSAPPYGAYGGAEVRWCPAARTRAYLSSFAAFTRASLVTAPT